MAIFADCDGNPVDVPSDVFDDIQEVLDQSDVSSRAWAQVASEAEALGFETAASWIRNNKFKYTCGATTDGFNPV